jgi:hypothetical protein
MGSSPIGPSKETHSHFVGAFLWKRNCVAIIARESYVGNTALAVHRSSYHCPYKKHPIIATRGVFYMVRLPPNYFIFVT